MNSLVGWVLLALSVALVNAGSGLMALYILLICVGWTIFLFFPVKMALKWLARKTGSSLFRFDCHALNLITKNLRSRNWAFCLLHDRHHDDSFWIGIFHRRNWRPGHFRYVKGAYMRIELLILVTVCM
jgi:hypothetical protein